jgi:hypothetical protein
VIWEPFAIALVLGLLISAGLYFAYLWPSVEPLDEQSGEEEDGGHAGVARGVAPSPRGIGEAPQPGADAIEASPEQPAAASEHSSDAERSPT